MNEQDRRIGAFLSQYIKPTSGKIEDLMIPAVQKDAIVLLIESEVMTEEEIRKEAVRDYEVIIPYFLFPEEGEKNETD